jgi:hypothetical protein
MSIVLYNMLHVEEADSLRPFSRNSRPRLYLPWMPHTLLSALSVTLVAHMGTPAGSSHIP